MQTNKSSKRIIFPSFHPGPEKSKLAESLDSYIRRLVSAIEVMDKKLRMVSVGVDSGEYERFYDIRASSSSRSHRWSTSLTKREDDIVSGLDRSDRNPPGEKKV